MNRKSILAIDDDSGIRDCLSEIFSVVGYDVRVEENGLEAMRYLEGLPDSRWPDLIVLDNRMPVMSGEEFLIELGRKYPNVGKKIPILYFSASKSGQIPAEGPRWQIKVLEKLTDLDVLLTLVRSLIGPPERDSGYEARQFG